MISIINGRLRLQDVQAQLEFDNISNAESPQKNTLLSKLGSSPLKIFTAIIRKSHPLLSQTLIVVKITVLREWISSKSETLMMTDSGLPVSSKFDVLNFLWMTDWE